ncbi:hypothetical protein TrVE_jg14341 [Triparma verrucosa]|uniref:Uncharacterized protein n=2 Tax=Triparma TaxID=722752 RepID=A0A9W6ZL86_9STRA|nr:hypothetical protein TrST_g3710 [Triparma strigata]GMH93386.1 hypothetical protein TrVE_jg14341 [Triparma verrucosa]
MFASRLLSRTASRTRIAQRRWGSMDVKKNKHVEEWNGKREITEKTFEFDSTSVPWLLGTMLAFPAFVWYWTADEMSKRPEFKGRTC